MLQTWWLLWLFVGVVGGCLLLAFVGGGGGCGGDVDVGVGDEGVWIICIYMHICVYECV